MTDAEKAIRRKVQAEKKLRSQLAEVRKVVGLPTSNDQDIEVSLSALFQFKDKYDRAQEELEEVLDVEDVLNKHTNDYMLLVQETQKLEAEAKATIRQRTVGIPASVHQNANPITPRLPEIKLPTFAGEVLKFAGYWDVFRVSIHENQRLDPVQKFSYLKGSLEANALKMIDGFTVTSANYEAAVNVLLERYHKPRIVVEGHVNAIVDLEHRARADAVGMRQFYDTCESHIRSLRAMGKDPDTGNLPPSEILIPLMKRKLPPIYLKKWEVAVSESSSDITVERFLKFLRNEVEIDETMAASMAHRKENFSRASQPRPVRNESKSSTVAFKATAKGAEELCPFCAESVHKTIEECKKIRSLDVGQRLSIAREHSLCFLCLVFKHHRETCSQQGCGVRNCKHEHHPFLHRVSQTRLSDPATKQTEKDGQKVRSMMVRGKSSRGILQVVEGILTTQEGKKVPVSILLDPGSDASFVKAELASNLGMGGFNERIRLDTVFNPSKHAMCRLVSFAISPVGSEQVGNTVHVEALTLRRVASDIEPVEVDVARYGHLQGLRLAPGSNSAVASVDVLIGSDYYFDFLTGEIKKGGTGEPSAVRTVFGWVICGSRRTRPDEHQSKVCAQRVSVVEDGPSHDLRRFWQMEESGLDDIGEVSTKHAKASIDQEMEAVHQRYKSTVEYVDGRYQVQFPWNSEGNDMPNNFRLAFKRLLSMERRLKDDPKRQAEYWKALQEFEELGFAEEVHAPDPGSERFVWYLPHHGVWQEQRETTKLRVVIDGSARYEGTCINARLHSGPSLQPDIVGVISRFRSNKIPLMSDIRKMFMQVSIRPDDRDFTRYLVRSKEGRLRIMRFTRVCFGLNASPFLAIGAIQFHADRSRLKYPVAAREVLRNMYVDDFVTGQPDVESAKRLVKDSVEMMKAGGFELVKWVSSSDEALSDVPQEDRSQVMRQAATDQVSKVLGVRWHVSKDSLGVVSRFTRVPQEGLTKRVMLREVASIFDPLGLVSPYVVTAKIILQELWLLGVPWDAPIPDDIACRWKVWRADLPKISEVQVPRHISVASSGVQIHAFGDASEKAYGSVVYAVAPSATGSACYLLASKSRVAPVKKQTLPRLELMAALLTAKLTKFLIKEMDLESADVCLWGDSEIVLHWITGQRSTDTFVSNRVSKIVGLVGSDKWRHCPGEGNPADRVSRGFPLSKLLSLKEWWNGPSWVSSFDPGKHPPFSNSTVAVRAVLSSKDPKTDLQYPLDPSRYSFDKSIAVIAWICRFVENCRKRKDGRESGDLAVRELRSSKQRWIKLAQQEKFAEEIEALQNGQPVSSKSSLLKLDPFLDTAGVVRVGGRISMSSLSYAAKHPIVLPHASVVTWKLIELAHVTELHAGADYTLVALRRTFWIPKARQLVKSVIHQCRVCRRFRAKASTQKMGELPPERVNESKPFEICGVDFAGPVYVKGSESEKTYICLFVCTTTRAVHLELVRDQSVNGFLLALRRMSARRGPVRKIISDNAKTFKAASKILQNERTMKKVMERLQRQGIEWSFIPERGPWQGGMYERIVRSVKCPLRKILWKSCLNFEQLHTVLAEIECHLNSRPLTSVSDSIDDFEVLTPAHFLTGKGVDSSTLFDSEKVGRNKTTLRERWKHMQRVTTQVWNRWRKEYVVCLQQRRKWMNPEQNLRTGDLVLIEDECRPRGTWSLGRVLEVKPGRDGLVRSVMLKTSTGTMRRPIQRLYLLEADEQRANPAREDVPDNGTTR